MTQARPVPGERPGETRRPRSRAAAADQLELEFVRFGPRDKPLDLRVDLGAETVWATQGQMAELFGVSASVVAKQLDALSGEKTLETTRPGGPGTGDFYDLDTILCIGYRVSSGKAATFRRWAGQILRASAVDGFALNEARMRDDPAAADRLAARLRGAAGRRNQHLRHGPSLLPRSRCRPRRRFHRCPTLSVPCCRTSSSSP